jgi:hypothetical protein
MEVAVALKEKYVVTAPGVKAGFRVEHNSRVTAERDMRHLEEQGFTPKMVTVLVPVTQPTLAWR